jgi:hypothetical protein
MPASVAALLAAVLLQGAEQALRKSDLIRLLSSSALPPPELAELVGRRCLSFTPSARDKSDLRELGADDALMRRIDECARRNAALHATARLREAVIVSGGQAVVTVQIERGERPAAGVRLALRGSGRLTGDADLVATTDERGAARFELRGAALGTHRLTVAAVGEALENPPSVDLTVRPAPAIVAAARTGFVSGLGQHGRVGSRLPLPLVFQVRDSANAPIVGRAVKLTAVNARLEGVTETTDSAGQIRATVVLGERAGPVRITATLGPIEREASLVADPGPPARLEVRCGSVVAQGRLSIAGAATVPIEVAARDKFGNRLAVTGLRVSVGDEDVLRALDIAGDTAMGRFTLRGGRAGSTNLVVLASGLRESLVAAVTAADAAATCRGGVPRG